MKNFKKLKIWEQAMEVVRKTYSLSKQLPAAERYGLTSQITRAAVSIPSNIAEGSSRTTDKEKKRFAEIALGSAFELETQLLIIKEIGWANAEEWDKLMECLHVEQRMINSYISTLKRNS
ncbi:four helix bundle protein [Arenibacter sp. GZD96]|uniref:four helix bundle protein n=1 Tax=Aurantibrevibacter litoralis TaxID=3106030 RepID=UPI002AFE2C36|nr:four helix bundle protein [Arenibacter sp. GZD-96]MEA1785996.1 four helix bundle protein [Arenibacter sp. GZD-96]